MLVYIDMYVCTFGYATPASFHPNYEVTRVTRHMALFHPCVISIHLALINKILIYSNCSKSSSMVHHGWLGMDDADGYSGSLSQTQ